MTMNDADAEWAAFEALLERRRINLAYHECSSADYSEEPDPLETLVNRPDSDDLRATRVSALKRVEAFKKKLKGAAGGISQELIEEAREINLKMHIDEVISTLFSLMAKPTSSMIGPAVAFAEAMHRDYVEFEQKLPAAVQSYLKGTFQADHVCYERAMFVLRLYTVGVLKDAAFIMNLAKVVIVPPGEQQADGDVLLGAAPARAIKAFLDEALFFFQTPPAHQARLQQLQRDKPRLYREAARLFPGANADQCRRILAKYLDAVSAYYYAGRWRAIADRKRLAVKRIYTLVVIGSVSQEDVEPNAAAVMSAWTVERLLRRIALLDSPSKAPRLGPLLFAEYEPLVTEESAASPDEVERLVADAAAREEGLGRLQVAQIPDLVVPICPRKKAAAGASIQPALAAMFGMLTQQSVHSARVLAVHIVERLSPASCDIFLSCLLKMAHEFPSMLPLVVYVVALVGTYSSGFRNAAVAIVSRSLANSAFSAVNVRLYSMFYLAGLVGFDPVMSYLERTSGCLLDGAGAARSFSVVIRLCKMKLLRDAPEPARVEGLLADVVRVCDSRPESMVLLSLRDSVLFSTSPIKYPQSADRTIPEQFLLSNFLSVRTGAQADYVVQLVKQVPPTPRWVAFVAKMFLKSHKMPVSALRYVVYILDAVSAVPGFDGMSVRVLDTLAEMIQYRLETGDTANKSRSKFEATLFGLVARSDPPSFARSAAMMLRFVLCYGRDSRTAAMGLSERIDPPGDSTRIHIIMALLLNSFPESALMDSDIKSFLARYCIFFQAYILQKMFAGISIESSDVSSIVSRFGARRLSLQNAAALLDKCVTRSDIACGYITESQMEFLKKQSLELSSSFFDFYDDDDD